MTNDELELAKWQAAYVRLFALCVLIEPRFRNTDEFVKHACFSARLLLDQSPHFDMDALIAEARGIANKINAT